MKKTDVLTATNMYKQGDMFLPPVITANRDEIIDFDNLRENLTQKLKLDNWFLFTSSQSLYIFNVDKKTNGNLSIRNTIRIDFDLLVMVYGANDYIILSLKLCSCPQLQTLIEQFGCNVKCDDDAFVAKVAKEKTDQANDAATFEFCAINAEADAGDLHHPFTELIEVKIEPSQDTDDLLNNFFHNGPPYICSICGKAFDQNARLMLHKKLHETQICSICNEAYIGRLDQHMRKCQSDEKSYQCHLCRRKYLTLPGLQRHMQMKHDPASDGQITKAKIKKVVAKKPSRLTFEHKQLEWVQEASKRVRNKEPVFFAHNENEIFTPEIRSHSKGGTQWMRKCTVCNKEFYTKKQFNGHKYRHDKSKWKECLICNRSYDNLQRHMNDVHSDKKNHVCEICGSAYKQMATLTEHMNTRHSQDLEFFCDICKNGKNHRSRVALKKHLRTVHSTESNTTAAARKKQFYKCDLCDAQYTQKYPLKVHKSLKHDGKEKDPQFHCKLCDKRFVRKQGLNSHRKIHNVGTHICPECGRTFNQADYLRKHLKRHSELKYRKCSMCDKRFIENVELRSHMNKVHDIVVPIDTQHLNKKYITE